MTMVLKEDGCLFQESLPVEEMILVLKELEELTKCPICLSVLIPPLCYCENGHYICSSCKKDLTACPTCRASFVESRIIPALVRGVLSIVPKECKHSVNGCKKLISPLVLKEHERRCSFRKVPCRIVTCTWESTARNLLNHIRTQHPKTHIFKTHSQVTLINFEMNENKIFIAPVLGKNSIFWMFAKQDKKKGKLMVFFVCVPTKYSQTYNFYSVTSFHNENPYAEYKFMQKVFEEDLDTNDIFSCEDCMIVPMAELYNFITNKNLTFNFQIIFRK